MISPDTRKVGEALAARTRKAQGLPRHVRDRDTARRVAALLVSPKSDGPRIIPMPRATATTYQGVQRDGAYPPDR